MLEELFKKGYLEYEKVMLDYAKPLGLNAEEAFVLIKILDNYIYSGTLSLDELQNQLLMASSKIDKIVASLMERGYYEVYLSYDNGKGIECISFKPLFERLEKLLNQNTELDLYDIEKANQYISSKMNRVLTANELEILQGFMVEDHYTYEQIVSAVDSIVAGKKLLSMRTLTVALANHKQEVSVSKEAPKVFKDFLSRL